MYKSIKLVVDTETAEDDIKQILHILQEKFEHSIEVYSDNYTIEDKEDILYLLYLSDNAIKSFMYGLKPNAHIAILPHPSAVKAMETYEIVAEMDEAINIALDETHLSKIDLLLCNDTIVFDKVAIGEIHGLNRYVQIFKKLKELKFQNYTFTTAKENVIQTAACGVTVVEGYIPGKKTLFEEHLSFHDGKLSAFIFAPHSLLSYIWHMLSLFFYQKFSLNTLPKSLGYIQTSQLTISSSRDFEYRLDDISLNAKELEFKVIQDAFYVHISKKIDPDLQEALAHQDQDESIKITSLPSGELKEFLTEANIPLFKRAGEEQFKTLFVSLKEGATFSTSFAILMSLSVLLATTGLYANSSPVIIGAMILAPLMSPLVSLAMGTIRVDSVLLIKSLKTLFFGIVLALLFSSFYAFIIPLKQITTEMASRLHPNLLDLGVAIISGIAGAYANAKEEVAKSLAGVAIAVALVPPLSVVGIGIGLMNVEVIFGASLLFITNLIGIILSASLTFVFLGYSPIKRAAKSLLITSVMVVVVSVPLIVSFNQLIEKNLIYNQLVPLKEIDINGKQIEITLQKVNIQNDIVYIDLDIAGSRLLSDEELYLLKQKFENILKKEIVMTLSVKILLKSQKV